MQPLAFLFPGQGSQAVGMGQELGRVSRAARDALAEADDALGFHLTRLLAEGPLETLSLTEHAQPAIVAVSVAAMRAFAEAGGEPSTLAAGHSLGEYAALVCAGSISFGDALQAVRLRGQLMQQAVPVGEGAMAAVIGLEAEVVERVVRGVSRDAAPVACAGFNTPEQTTISGAASAVALASARLSEAGATRVLPLAVSAPFHSPLMQPVEDPLREALTAVTLSPMRHAVVSNVDAMPYDDSDVVVDRLIAQLTRPVQWVASIRRMRALGVARFVELGHGSSLAGMVRRIDRTAAVLSVGDAAGIARALEHSQL